MAIVAELPNTETGRKKKRKAKKNPDQTAPSPQHSILLVKPTRNGSLKHTTAKKSKPNSTFQKHSILLVKPAVDSSAKDAVAKGLKRPREAEDDKRPKKKKGRKKQKFTSNDTSIGEGSAPKTKGQNRITSAAGSKKIVSEQKAGSRFQKPLLHKKSFKSKDKNEASVEAPTQHAESFKKNQFKKTKQFDSKKRKADDSEGSEPPRKKQMKEKEKKMVELSKKERKLLRKTVKNNYELSMKAKKLWEVLRNHEKSKDEAKKLHLCQQLHNLVKGKVTELIFAHDTCRVIECLVAMGNADIRTALYEELKGETLKLSKSVYAKFFVLKLLKYGTKEQRNQLIASVYGNVVKLIAHSEAANVVEEMYNEYALANQRTAMIEEFYGPTFQLFKDNEIRTLDQVLAKDPSKKDSILAYMKETLMKIVNKSVLRHSLIHHVLYEYITHCTEKDREEMIESLRESLAEIVHTRDGSRVAMHCIWHGTTKDRKMIIKSFKTHVVKMCKEEHGHMVLMAVFDCVDDTRLVHKALLDEIIHSLKEVIFDQHGRKVILHLLSPRDTVYQHPDIIRLLKQGDGNAYSKKDQDVRWKELLAAVSPQLSSAFAENLREIIASPPASIVAQAIVKNGLSGDPSSLFSKIAGLVAEPLEPGSKGKSHIVEDPAGHMLIKRLIKEDKRRAENGDSTELFCRHLLETVPTSAYSKWIECNRATFILVSILETDIEEITEKLKMLLEPLEKHIKKKQFKGAQILMKKL